MKNYLFTSLSGIIIFIISLNLSLKSQNLDAQFLASEYTIIAGECINFTDHSTGMPTFWQWSFPGSETLTSNMQNPINICYLIPGEYDVVLEVQNSTSIDQEYVNACITVLENTVSPIANFTSDYRVVNEGGYIVFEDLSQNDPVLWNWVFEGGIPEVSNDQYPAPVGYLEPGLYKVYLRVEDDMGQESEILREEYIKVVPNSYVHPTANFQASRTFIAPEEAISFTDLTTGNPYRWTWYFEGGSPSSSTEQHPSSIQYNEPGVYRVQLNVQNNLGENTFLREEYIVVSETDPCTDIPIPQFSASQRLIRHSTRVYFEDESLNNPTSWNWYFEGGYPTYSSLSNPNHGIEYNWPGIYKVSLAVNNQCGSDIMVKHDYMFVFSGPVPKYCDTITNIRNDETIVNMPLSSSWGHIGGHNGQKIRTYADKFDQYSFTTIEGLIIPVHKAESGTWNSKVTFYVWDGNSIYPESDKILFQKDVYIRNIDENYYNYIEFENPIEVEGPFFVGYRINYVDVSGNGISDDRFVVSVASNRNYWGAVNTLYVEQGGEWQTAHEKFNVRTSTAIMPVTCIVDITEFEVENNISVYPNPASSFIKINQGDLSPGTVLNVQLIDITGKIVFSKDTFTGYDEISINTQDYPNGLYFVNLMFDDKRVTKKLMIMH
jgi:PKD repeat protein